MVLKGKEIETPPSQKSKDSERIILPKDEILVDKWNRPWKLDNCVGKGAYGFIYLARNNSAYASGKDADNVVKVESQYSKGLMRELFFYLKITKEDIDIWKEKHNIIFLGMPECLGYGSHIYQGLSFNFIVMQRLGRDLRKILVENENILPAKKVFTLGIRILDILEYVHSLGHVHADIKASNLVVGQDETKEDEVYLIDFGLSMKFCSRGEHKKFVKRRVVKGPTGTCLFASRDAHMGCPFSRRADLEILGYNLIFWLSGHLPWRDFYKDHNAVKESKVLYMRYVPSFVRDCFQSQEVPKGIAQYLFYVASLDFEQQPNYKRCYEIFKSAIASCSQ